jgi:hypothetical protein
VQEQQGRAVSEPKLVHQKPGDGGLIGHDGSIAESA